MGWFCVGAREQRHPGARRGGQGPHCVFQLLGGADVSLTSGDQHLLLLHRLPGVSPESHPEMSQCKKNRRQQARGVSAGKIRRAGKTFLAAWHTGEKSQVTLPSPSVWILRARRES